MTWPLDVRHGAVQLKIGKHVRRVRARGRGRRRPTVVDATVSVHGHRLTIDETRLRGRPKVRIEVKRIGDLRPVARTTKPAPATMPAPATPGLTAGSSGSSSASGPAGDPGSWRSVFDDEFTGSSVDPSKWSIGWFGSGVTKAVNSSETACYDPSHVSEANGELDLTLTAQSASCGQPYDGAAVTTNGHFQFTYGFVEVRAWLAGNGSTVYDWPQIWLDGQNWPSDGEIDILEGLGGNACYHWHGPPNGTGYGGCPAGAFAGGWHTFGVDWEPGSVTYYYDGTNVGSVTNSTSQITGDPMYVILVASTSPGSNTQTPATERFKYVRVWQH